MDIFGRKLYGADPAQHFCPAWTQKNRRTYYLNLCDPRPAVADTKICRAVGWFKVPQIDPVAMIDVFDGTPPDSLRGSSLISLNVVTVLTEGSVKTASGVTLNAGDVVHSSAGSEHFSGSVAQGTAPVRGAQIFISLPVTTVVSTTFVKTYTPTSQSWELEAGVGAAKVTVFAGDLLGRVGPVKLQSPFLIFDIKVPANSEVLLPIPAYLEVFFVILSGNGYIGGDSAIDPVQEEQGLYASGTGTFDFTRTPDRAVGSRVFKNIVGSFSHTGVRTNNRGYGGIDDLVLTSLHTEMHVLIVGADPIDAPLSSLAAIEGIHRQAAEAVANSAARAKLEEARRARGHDTKRAAASKKQRRLKVEAQFAGREEGWDANVRQQEFKRDQAARQQAAAKKQKRVRSAAAPTPTRAPAPPPKAPAAAKAPPPPAPKAATPTPASVPTPGRSSGPGGAGSSPVGQPTAPQGGSAAGGPKAPSSAPAPAPETPQAAALGGGGSAPGATQQAPPSVSGPASGASPGQEPGSPPPPPPVPASTGPVVDKQAGAAPDSGAAPPPATPTVTDTAPIGTDAAGGSPTGVAVEEPTGAAGSGGGGGAAGDPGPAAQGDPASQLPPKKKVKKIVKVKRPAGAPGSPE